MVEMETNLTPTECCSRCGQPRHSLVMSGLCPVCLLESMDFGSVLTWSRQVWKPPSVESWQKSIGADYQIVEFLGRGGMGAVYRAIQPTLGDRNVAIKCLPKELSGSPSFARLFRREAAVLANLSHPNIVTVHDFDETPDGHLFFVMEYMDGTDLANLKKRGELNASKIFHVMTQILRAVEYLHSNGLVHRDIKPSNIFLNADGTAKLGDFGLSMILSEFASNAPELPGVPTVPDFLVGTPGFAAPELSSKGNKKNDHRADIYSIGVTLRELSENATSPSHTLKYPQFEKVIEKATAPQARDRYSDVEKLRKALTIANLFGRLKVPLFLTVLGVVVIATVSLIFQTYSKNKWENVALDLSDELEDWSPLVSFRPPHSIQEAALRTLERKISIRPQYACWFVQRIEDGIGPINLDFYPVLVKKMPKVDGERLRSDQLLTYCRFHLNKLTNSRFTHWEPYNFKMKNRRMELGAYIYIHMNTGPLKTSNGEAIGPLREEGATILSHLDDDRCIFSTVYTRGFRFEQDDGKDRSQKPSIQSNAGGYYHPRSGHREFGYLPMGEGALFYTRGAERVSVGQYLQKYREAFEHLGEQSVSDSKFGKEYAIFQIANENWLAYQLKLADFVNQNGGKALVLPAKSELHSWDELVTQEIHRPILSWIDSLGNEGVAKFARYPGREAETWLHPMVDIADALNRTQHNKRPLHEPPRSFVPPPFIE